MPADWIDDDGQGTEVGDRNGGVSFGHLLLGLAGIAAPAAAAIVWLAIGKNDAEMALALARELAPRLSMVENHQAVTDGWSSKFSDLKTAIGSIGAKFDALQQPLQALAVLNSQMGDIRASEAELRGNLSTLTGIVQQQTSQINELRMIVRGQRDGRGTPRGDAPDTTRAPG